MNALNYEIRPVLAGGIVKTINDDNVVIHLNGRLGVIDVVKDLFKDISSLKEKDSVKFYFSYVEVVDKALAFDRYSFNKQYEISPELVSGKIIEVNDTAAKIAIGHNLGTIAVPRRWLFTDIALEEGLEVQFYLSCIENNDN